MHYHQLLQQQLRTPQKRALMFASLTKNFYEKIIVPIRRHLLGML